MRAHDAAAAQMEEGHGGLYALVWGEPVLPERSTAIWLTRPRGIERRPVLEGHCGSNFRKRHYGAVRWCSGQARSLLFIILLGVDAFAPAGWSAPAIERVRSMRPLIRD